MNISAYRYYPGDLVQVYREDCNGYVYGTVEPDAFGCFIRSGTEIRVRLIEAEHMLLPAISWSPIETALNLSR
jgi:hypothetical protein